MTEPATKVSDLTILNRKRGAIKGQITRIENCVNAETPPDSKVLELKLSSLNNLKEKINSLRNESFCSLPNDKDVEDFEGTLTEVEDYLEETEVSIFNLLKIQNTSSSKAEKANSESIANAKIKLPSISLPHFSGKYTEWLTFKSQFITLIDSNKQLSDSQKLFYLQSALTGTAKQLQNIDDSYSSLFEALKNRYENKRLIVQSHISEILNANKLKCENPKDLRYLTDNLLNNLRALKQLDLNMNALSEAILMNVMLQRLDEESRKVFEMSLDCNDLPNWEKFVEFLLKRIQALENVQRSVPVAKFKQEYTGSEICACTQEVADLLKLKSRSVNFLITGLNGAGLKVTKEINVIISNKSKSFQKTIKMLVIPKITDLTPSKHLDISNLKLPQLLMYANPNFFKPQRAQVLLGDNVFYELLRTGQIKVKDSSVILQNSVFGWIATGTLNYRENRNFKCYVVEDKTEAALKQFWTLESFGIKDDSKRSDEDAALEVFNKTVRYNNERYEVSFPWKKNWKELNDNFEVAERRFQGLVKKMKRDKTLYIQYSEILKEYLANGIIEEVKEPEKRIDRPVFYLPHHAVFKQQSVYTKCRIVFDASSNDVGQLSLNDCLWSGINLNPHIFQLLIYFRINKIAMLSDIERAFLQISLNEFDRDVVRFLFVKHDPNKNDNVEVVVYRFLRLTFGINVSPFLLSATIKEHIKKYEEAYPVTTEVLNTCFYVDDLVTGADNIKDALKISIEANNIMKKASMNLRKWISNDEVLMKMWEEREFDILPSNFSNNCNEPCKVLGLPWYIKEDTFAIEVKDLLEFIKTGKNTKRFVLQVAGRIFDPLGFVTPYTIRIKCLFQELWIRKISWDAELPDDILKIWNRWCFELPTLLKLQIPRNVLDCAELSSCDIELHTFSDASPKAYGAVVFVLIRSDDKVIVNFLTSKSRVAPLKRITLPRMELLRALLARLANEVANVLKRKISPPMYFWTDSQIALYWIRGSALKWKTFVCNRVKEIQELTDPDKWFFCVSRDNPSDALTRSISIDQLLENTAWWYGPTFLKSVNIYSTDHLSVVPEEGAIDKELKPNLKTEPNERLMNLIARNENSVFDCILNKSNNYMKLIRIVSFLYRFIYNCKNPKSKKIGPLSIDESANAENWLIRSLQEGEFSDEFKRLTNGKQVHSRSKLSSINVILDKNKVMRVGERLSHADLSYATKHPMVLPAKHPLTSIILRNVHLKYLHVGPQALLHQVRQKFWPLNGRNSCRKIVRNCVICFKNRPVTVSQIMAELPKDRVNPSYPFFVTGIDFCGPLSNLKIKGRVY
ncbi:uncharacterized protein LOC129224750 [Uloborus diversus]|uniref:uncharacterized protein LOC129224750 n=1 Tax=Uloborus diversus TaxID=327109 RepID=UPI00240A3596|nr:uncharacterized protein LOC129224750 [Uloborus diversus]